MHCLPLACFGFHSKINIEKVIKMVQITMRTIALKRQQLKFIALLRCVENAVRQVVAHMHHHRLLEIIVDWLAKWTKMKVPSDKSEGRK